MRNYDVIIVGAGPGGLKCAENLKNTTLSVLLIDKNKYEKIGDKICAGGVTGKDMEYLKIPENLIERKYNSLLFKVGTKSKKIKHNQNLINTISRHKLGQWQLKEIKGSKNIDILTNTFVKDIQKDYISIKGEKIGYKYLVGADGSNSMVRKYLDIPVNNFDIAIQYIIPTTKYKDLELHLNSKLFGSWYAWIFPHKKNVSVGYGYNPQVLKTKDLQKNFMTWLGNNNIDIKDGEYQIAIINYDYQGHKFDNIFLVGDAAGFASGITGEGIFQAMISGEEIAKTILDSNYKSKAMTNLIKTKKLHDQILKYSIKLGDFRKIFYRIALLFCNIPYIRKIAIKILL